MSVKHFRVWVSGLFANLGIWTRALMQCLRERIRYHSHWSVWFIPLRKEKYGYSFVVGCHPSCCKGLIEINWWDLADKSSPLNYLSPQEFRVDEFLKELKVKEMRDTKKTHRDLHPSKLMVTLPSSANCLCESQSNTYKQLSYMETTQIHME